MNEHQVKSLPAPLELELLSVCSSQIPETKSLSLHASYQKPWGAAGAESILVLCQCLAETISHPGRLPGQVIQIAVGLTAGFWSRQWEAISHHTMCPTLCHCPSPSSLGSVFAHPRDFSRLSHLSSLALCPLSYTAKVFQVHWTAVGQFQESCSAVSSFGWSLYS